jgi:hypothetical protein
MPTHLCDRCGEPASVGFHADRQEWVPRYWALENGVKLTYCSEECIEIDILRIAEVEGLIQ